MAMEPTVSRPKLARVPSLGEDHRMDRDRHDIGRLLFTWLVDAIALGVAVWLVGGVRSSSYLAIAAAGLVFGLASTYLKPALILLGIPFIVVTLGIGLFMINMLIVWLTAAIVPGFDAVGFWPIAKAAVVIWLVNMLLGGLWPERRRTRRSFSFGS
jgi:putative membrane protein